MRGGCEGLGDFESNLPLSLSLSLAINGGNPKTRFLSFSRPVDLIFLSFPLFPVEAVWAGCNVWHRGRNGIPDGRLQQLKTQRVFKHANPAETTVQVVGPSLGSERSVSANCKGLWI